MMLSIIFLFLWQAAGTPTKPVTPNCILTEGRGADFAILGVTKQGEASSPPSEMQLLYEDNVLVEIFAYGDQCRTSRGIKMGDSERAVEKIYGKGEKKVIYLSKGKHDVLGPIGDYVLQYPGVAFVISKHNVIAIFIRPKFPAS